MALAVKKKKEKVVELEQDESTVSSELMDRARAVIEQTFDLSDKGYTVTGFSVKKDCVVLTVTNGTFELTTKIFDGSLLGFDTSND